MQRSGRLRLTDVNEHLVCALCGGYYIDATTIVECLHSFCRSCLIKYLETNSFCPICDVQIHKAKPFLNIKPDKALQDIVYKLIPGLFHSEMRRRQEFYAKHPDRMYETTPEGRGVGVERLIYSPDDSISLSLEYLDGDEEETGCASKNSSESENETGIAKRYLQCPALVTIGHLKKFLRIKYELSSSYVVEIIHRRESLPDDYTLMDVAYIHTWKRNGPMRFFFRITPSASGTMLASSPHPPLVSNGSQSDRCSEPETAQVTGRSQSLESRCGNSDKDSTQKQPKIISQKPNHKSDIRKLEPNSNGSIEVPTSISTNSEKITVTVVPTTTTTTTTITEPQQKIVTLTTQSLQVPATVASIVSETKTSLSSSVQSLKIDSDGIATKETIKSVPGTQPPSAVVSTKTSPANKIVSSLSCSTADAPSLSTVPEIKPSKQNFETVTRVPTKSQNPGIKIEKQTELSSTESSASTESSLAQTQEASSEVAGKEANVVPSSEKTLISVKPLKPETQSLFPNVTSDDIRNDASQSSKEPPSLKEEASSKPQKLEICKTEPVNIASSSKEKIAHTEDSSKAACAENSVNLPASNVNTPKTAIKSIPRVQNSARKPTQPMKVVSDTVVNNKIQQVSNRHQSQTSKNIAKVPRATPKAVDKTVTAVENISQRKENSQNTLVNSEKNETVHKDSTNIVTNTADKVYQNSTASLPPLMNNAYSSNVKVPPQNQQIIKNNQQILKKNDEIMRCVSAVKRPIQPIPRKTTDSLKNSSVQLRPYDEKSNSKKRRITPINPLKRPACNSTEFTKSEDMQSIPKKPRPTPESTRKSSLPEQKPSQLKVQCPPSSQNNLKAMIKSESTATEGNSVVFRNGDNTAITNAKLELKNNILKKQEADTKNNLSDKVPSALTIQRSQTPQTSGSSRMTVSTTSTSNIKSEPVTSRSSVTSPPLKRSPTTTQTMTSPPTPVTAHSNTNSRLCPTPVPASVKNKTGSDGSGALDLSASPRRQQQPSILSIAQTLARRHQQQCPSPAPPPLSPLSSLSPFPVIPSVPVRSPPPPLRIPVPPHHRTGHSQQQRPSSLSSSSPSPPADTVPGNSRMGPPQQSDMFSSHLMNPAALMFRQQLELQRLWGAGKHNPAMGVEWFNDANSIKRFETLMKSLQQQQATGRNSPFYPFNNNNNNTTTAAATNNHRK